jgi:16S rRNA processing protein RimM
VAEPDARLELGWVGKAHGLRGEVVVHPVSNRPERFAAGAQLTVADVDRRIVSSRPHQDRYVVRFEGVEDRNAAEALRGARITGEPLGDPEDGEVWAHEVIGSEVLDRAGHFLGRVVAIEQNPAHDLLVLDSGPLVPMVFVVEQEAGRVVVDLPDGLLELFE